MFDWTAAGTTAMTHPADTPDILVVVYAVIYIATFINPLSTVDLINVVLSRPRDRILYVGVCFNLTYCTTLTRTYRNNNSLYRMGHESLVTLSTVTLEIMIRGRIFHYYLLEHTSSFEHRRFRLVGKVCTILLAAETIRKKKKTELQLQTSERTAVIFPPLLQSMLHLTIRKTVFATYRFYAFQRAFIVCEFNRTIRCSHGGSEKIAETLFA